MGASARAHSVNHLHHPSMPITLNSGSIAGIAALRQMRSAGEVFHDHPLMHYSACVAATQRFMRYTALPTQCTRDKIPTPASAEGTVHRPRHHASDCRSTRDHFAPSPSALRGNGGDRRYHSIRGDATRLCGMERSSTREYKAMFHCDPFSSRSTRV
ncbi:uncharacterized protein LAESUDRAFT_380018 [Laetiporus sulphureus 93-53]|uniref:Uncharacterized protein n=1 Tax=Laetiporus sulphureus 93-53 TaxID=1314785 RepID=A0A165CQH5_9APHY|nr:uncharacterized protein LAESUDRAFT_380018 [Laetiporus sulphureus 93-53]KZT03237.1 hypothetical protein LAESUDRAFT_380018 [Laetiporus sulphureus 93-53]